MDSEIFQAVYESILQRDTRYDGRYYVGVLTTGIVCRPSCRSRIPKPENIRIFESIEEALKHGFRPCKRCRPDSPGKDGPDAAIAKAVIALIRTRYNENWTLRSLASQLSMSPFHLQRIFKRTVGTTPAKELLNRRLEIARRLLIESDKPVLEIAREIGFRSSSHFAFVFQRATGSSPNDFRNQHLKTMPVILQRKVISNGKEVN